MSVWKTQIWQGVRITVLTVLVCAALVPTVHAAQSSSSHYQVNEVQFGNGSQLNACSTSYCAKTSVGETAVGNIASATYQAQAGFNSNREPSLAIIVPTQFVDFGVLTPGTPGYATAVFSVSSYLTNGYIVQTFGNPPTDETHSLSAMTSGGPSAPNTEQFGMNLVANTSPASFGADPAQEPDTTFSFGQAYNGYGTANSYKYNSGDFIAHTTKSSGVTDYTMSYLINVSKLTPGGTYTMQQILVATSTY